MTQNNLGNALSDLGTRSGGEEGRKLLADAVIGRILSRGNKVSIDQCGAEGPDALQGSIEASMAAIDLAGCSSLQPGTNKDPAPPVIPKFISASMAMSAGNLTFGSIFNRA